MATNGTKRPVKILNISGSPVDRRNALADAAASDEHVDVLVGDWMSELNMPQKAYGISLGEKRIGYEESFVEALEPALENIAKKGLKLACNAGTVATEELFKVVVKMVADKGLSLNVAWVEGDAVLKQVMTACKDGSVEFINKYTGKKLQDWELEPVFAQCYLGGWGIKTAFDNGADIVICGRVADASPIVAAAAWWHGWSREHFNELAQSLIAGHLIECSSYVCGGNFCGFKGLDWDTIDYLGFPFAEIAADGDVVISKQKGTGGMVSIETCKEQLLYEIQGCWYYNCDVTAVVNNAFFEEIGKDRVRLSGITGLPPPPFTKVGLTAFGGYKAELHFAMIGLDIPEKVAMIKKQILRSMGPERLAKYTTFEVSAMGSVPYNPMTQNSAVVDVRLFAQAKELSSIDEANFNRPALDHIMQHPPAATFHTLVPAKPYQEYFVSLIPQTLLNHTVHFSGGKASIPLPPPPNMKLLPTQQPSYPPTNPVSLASFGETVEAPLGYIVHARAGDKGSDCNIGLFVRHADEWDWLRSFLTTEKLQELMGDDFIGQKIDRMEFPKIWAVHFLLHDHLDRGVNANSSYDTLGKFLQEYVRCKPVALPKKFLDRGRI